MTREEEQEALYLSERRISMILLEGHVPHWAKEDVFHEAFFRAIRAWDTFKPQQSRHGGEATRAAWFHVILRNASITWVRSEKRRSVTMTSDLPHHSVSIEHLAEKNAEPSYDGLQDRVAEEDAINYAYRFAQRQFNDDVRVTMGLRILGYSNRGISRILKIPEGTVSSRKAKFRTALRAALNA